MDKAKIKQRSNKALKLASSTATKGLQKAANNPQTTITLMLLALIGFGGYKVYQNMFGDSKQDTARDKFDSSVTSLPYNPSSFTHSEADLTLITNNVFQAMNRYGTNEKTIIDNLSKLNKDEMYFVMKAFGMRLYSQGVEATTWMDKNFLSVKKDLIGWLKAELSGGSLDDVKTIFDNLKIPF